MKNIQLFIACLIGITFLFSSCQKDNSSITANSKLNFDAAYVVNGESNSISVVNLSSNKVDTTFNLPMYPGGSGMGMMGSGSGNTNMWPHHISLSPDKSKLAVALPGSDFYGGGSMMLSSFTAGSMMGNLSGKFTIQGKILILDATSGAVLKEITIDGISYNAVFSPDGKELWAAIMQPEGKVVVFDTTNFNVMNTINVGAMPSEVSFSDDGTKVYVANGMSNSVTVIDATTKQVLETPSVGNYPVGAWTGMFGMMDVDNEDSQSICFVDNATGTVKDTLSLGFVPGEIANNTMMGQMWVTDPNNGQVHIWGTNGSGYTSAGTISVGSGATAMAFSQDGTMCYVVNQNDGTVSVVDVATQKEVSKISVGKKPNGIVLRYH